MRTIAAIAAHPSFQAYRAALTNFATLNVTHETGVRSAFQNLLQALAVGEDMTLVPEQVVEGTRARPDGTLRDSYNLPRGYWEAKDTNDDLETEILKKKRKGYPFTNILFEDTQKGVLFQNQKRVFDADLRDTGQAATLLHTFLAWQEPDPTSFDNAQARFGEVIPDLARGLIDRIEKERAESPAFAAAFGKLFALCVETLNPQVQPGIVVEMLAQHLLTERLFRTIFDNSDFVQRNVIAHKVEETIQVMMSQSFNRSDFTKTLDKYYYPIESKAREATTWEQKQAFLNSLYERFFKDFSKKSADTQGIVYTPQPIVDFMLESVDSLLKSEFGTSLSHDGVVVLDPCVGTGNFMQNIVRRLKPMNLKRKYQTELFCNENMLLPYYIAGLNIEHAYYERAGAYEPFTGLCFTDTLLLENAFTTDSTGTLEYFDEENAERVQAQQEAKITVIIGNPPYNVGQKSENDNNKNRAYKVVDSRVASTYAKASKASNKNALSDPYVKFFRWATDRLQGSDGIVCFVSNNGFLTGIGADGMRKHLVNDFSTIYHLDCKGNARTSGERRRAEGGNVFDDAIRTGVGITVLIRRREGIRCLNGELPTPASIFYYAMPDYARSEAKLKALTAFGNITKVTWQQLTPDAKGNWLTEGMQADFETLLPLGTRDAKASKAEANAVFKTYSLGVAANRDEWVYNFSRTGLQARMQLFIQNYNLEVYRLSQQQTVPKNIDAFINNDQSFLKWTDRLKTALTKHERLTFDVSEMRNTSYRPFCRQYLYFDHLLNQRRYQQHHIFPAPESEIENIVICSQSIGCSKSFHCLATNNIPDLHFTGDTQCFPYYVYDEDGTNRRENITDWALQQFQTAHGSDVTKRDIFHYVYALLHDPAYRTRYAENLKRELPRIPLVGDSGTFAALATAGHALIDLHIGYETAPEYPLTEVYEQTATLSDIFHVEKMRLIEDKTAMQINPYLTLRGIPPEAHTYKLGNRSALDWVIDQYRVRGDSDPNRADEPEYIVRLVKRVVTVSVETMRIVASLPDLGLATQD